MLRRLSHTLFGLALLGTLWVTSLSNLSARPTATAILTDLGAQVLNPYLVAKTQGNFGIGQTQYATLEQVAKARPNQPLSLPGLKVSVLGSEIAGLPYTSGVRLIYGKVANAYYDGGAGAVFAIPQQFAQVIDTYGVFELPSSATPGSPTQPGSASAAPSLPQIPSFLQPFFFALGLSPATMTAQGHARIASTLLWWWLGVIIFGLLAILFNGGSLQSSQTRRHSPIVQRAITSLGSLGHSVEVVFDALTAGARRVSSVGWATFSAAMPGVLLIAVAWVLTFYAYPQQLHPFADALLQVTGAFLPVYGGGMIVGLIVAAAPWLALGVILLLGLLAGALLVFMPRRTPATQPYIPSAPAQPYTPSAPMLSGGPNGYSGYAAPTGYPGSGYPNSGYPGYSNGPTGAYGAPPNAPTAPVAPDASTMPAAPYYSPPGSENRPSAPPPY